MDAKDLSVASTLEKVGKPSVASRSSPTPYLGTLKFLYQLV